MENNHNKPHYQVANYKPYARVVIVSEVPGYATPVATPFVGTIIVCSQKLVAQTVALLSGADDRNPGNYVKHQVYYLLEDHVPANETPEGIAKNYVKACIEFRHVAKDGILRDYTFYIGAINPAQEILEILAS